MVYALLSGPKMSTHFSLRKWYTRLSFLLCDLGSCNRPKEEGSHGGLYPFYQVIEIKLPLRRL